VQRIIVIDSHPEAYAGMLENIRLNNMEGVIVPVNADLANEPGEILVENISTNTTTATRHGAGDRESGSLAIILGE